MKTHLIYILIILGLIGGLIFQKNYYINQKPTIETIIDTNTEYSKKIKPKTTKPKIIYQEVIKTIDRPYPVLVKGKTDTIEIIRDFNTLKVFNDVITFDSLGDINITDYVFNNNIVSRKVENNIRIPITTNTITNTVLYPPKNNLYLGMNTVFNNSNILYVGPNIMLQTKKKTIYFIGVGLNPLDLTNFHYSVGFGIKIGKK